MAGRVLVTGDRDTERRRLSAALTERGYTTTSAVAVQPDEPSPACDVVVATGKDAIDVCREMCRRLSASVVVLDDAPAMPRAISALRAGAADYVSNPRDMDAVEAAVRRVLEQRLLHDRVGRLGARAAAADSSEQRFLGESVAVRQVREKLARLAESDATVLVTGESGTGKEVVARVLHRAGPRRAGPFIAVNCAALPAQLVESEFFGHARGAFTDASRARSGLLVQASGGTLFLDEISAMPSPAQAKLLRALQERVVRPLGQRTEIEFDARLVAASNVSLEAEVAAGRFRHDLYFRLNVVQIRLPPLRQRGLDVLLLAQHFIRQFAEASGRQVVGMTLGAARVLLAYDWPGNVRELRNWMEAAVALARHDHVTESELSPNLTRGGAPLEPTPDGEQLLSWDHLEAHHIAAVLQEVGGNKARAARVLGIDRKTLYRKLSRYGLGGASGRTSEPPDGPDDSMH